jgi:beta-lactamase regulating signal transducer with metallopeptidase domain
MSALELLGVGVLLAWAGLPLLALATRGEADPASRHRQLLVTLALGAGFFALPFVRELLPAHPSAPGPVLKVVATATGLVAHRADRPGVLTLIAAAWLALVLLSTVATGVRVVRLRRVLRRASLASEADTILALKVARSLEVDPTLVLVSRETSVPFVAALFRPCVVLPADVRAHLNEAQLTCVFEHELSHLHRGDQLWALAVSLLRIPFVFHPTASSLARRAALAREEAVDAIASRRDAHAYAHTLLSVAELASTGLECSEAVFMSARALSRRITMLTSASRRSPSASLWPSLALAGLLSVAAVAAPGEAPLPPDAGAASVESLTVSLGAEKTLRVEGMQRVAVGDPNVADIRTIGDSKLVVTGAGKGQTTLLVWRTSGERLTWTITVK